jgi:chromosomal replication initiation ATPase DnaA
MEKINEYLKKQKESSLLREELKQEVINELTPKLKSELEKEIKLRIMTDIEKNYYLTPIRNGEINVDFFINMVIDKTSQAYFISINDIKSKNRVHPRPEARHVISYICRTMKQVPFVYIGKVLGGRNHATILWGKNQCLNLMTYDKEFKLLVDGIIKSVNNELVK